MTDVVYICKYGNHLILKIQFLDTWESDLKEFALDYAISIDTWESELKEFSLYYAISIDAISIDT
jgi:hypothetical protein